MVIAARNQKSVGTRVSLAVREPSSLVEVDDQCAAVEAWAERCDSIPELRDASNRLAAIREYVERTSMEGRARVEAAMRRLEVRIGALLGPAKPGPRQSSIATEDSLSPDQRHEFRKMAEHPGVVDEVIADSDDASPPSRRKVMERVRQIAERQQKKADAKAKARAETDAAFAPFRPENWGPEEQAADAELVRQRGALARVCREITDLGAPAVFCENHAAVLRDRTHYLDSVNAAHAWLTAFIEAMEE